MLLLSLVPTVVIFSVMAIKKCINKENIRRIIKLFLLGLLSIVIAVGFNFILGDYVFVFFDESSLFFILLRNFVFVGLLEEACKYIFVRIGTNKAPDKDDKTAMIVYAVTVALAFATVENISYLENSSIVLAIARALFSVPDHVAFEIIMGYHMAVSRNSKKALLYPALLHGAIDASLSLGDYSVLFVFVGVGIIIANYVNVFKLIKKVRSQD